jgi:hypothetical protein
MTDAKYSNRLLGETSPYLQQHAHNPVDWYPWGEEAFAAARAGNMPIFLSIGYSTCHWCHVMERESFEDDEVAAVLNANYISIKVDREERPDIDHVYMTVCQAITGRGGWPMSLLLTPDATPFFAATYIPKHPRGGAPGLMNLLEKAAQVWREDPDRLNASGDSIVNALGQLSSTSAGDQPFTIDRAVNDRACAHFKTNSDAEFGGFGDSPKFPSPHQISYLLEQYRQGGDSELLTISRRTLDAMRAGGIWDHFGYGFHRYTTDREWLTPHFEKMLYDQAGLAALYAKAYSITETSDYALTARQTLEYVERELSSPEGGFYCGEDADSEGEEGLFYIWSRSEVEGLLGKEAATRFCEAFDISAVGNYMEEATGQASCKNIPNQMDALQKGELVEGWAADYAEDFAGELKTLFTAREARAHPFKDDKVLTGWSAFMASAFAVTGSTLGDTSLVNRARKCVEFLNSMMMVDGRLMRSYRRGKVSVSIRAFAEDYAYLARAQLDLYAATWEEAYLLGATETAGNLYHLFGAEDGGLYDTARDAEKLIMRPREATDGAMPSATSVTVECFARLGLLTANTVWDERAAAIVSANRITLASHPNAFTHLLQGANLLAPDTLKIEVTGDRKSSAACEALGYLAQKTPFAGQTVFTHKSGGKLALQACDRTACRLTATTVGEFHKILGELVR